MKSNAVSLDELSKGLKSIKAPPEHIDPGLTAAYLGFKASGLAPSPPPAEKDPEKLRKNIALRDQFNAARLNIGMTEAEVEAMLKAKPLESGKVAAGNYSIYGSGVWFGVSDWRCFSLYLNILVVFRDGKAIAISSIKSGPDWRRNLDKALLICQSARRVTRRMMASSRHNKSAIRNPRSEIECRPAPITSASSSCSSATASCGT